MRFPTPFPFVGTPPDGGACPVQYELKIEETWWFVHYRWGSLCVYGNTGGPVEFTVAETKLQLQIGGQYDGFMGARETNVYLSFISESIASGDFSPEHYPPKTEVAKHPLYMLGPLPVYWVGMRCCNRHKTHSEECRIYVPAQDINAWIKDNPLEHGALKESGLKKAWKWVCAMLED